MSPCPDPTDCGLRHCLVCAGHLDDVEPRTCVACLGRVRRDLADIVELFALLPEQLGHLRPRPMDAAGGSGFSAPLPGGDVLAMLAPGSPGAFWRDRESGSRLDGTPWRPVQRLRHGHLVWSTDPAEQAEQAVSVVWESGAANPHQEDDPPAVAFELGQWEDDWRSERGEPASMEVATVAGAVGYLSLRAGWAADFHPAFDEFATDVARLRARLEVATSMDARPLRAVGVRCVRCETAPELRLGWGDGGLDDEWHCPRCRGTYTAEEYWLAVHQALIDEAREDA